MKNAISIRYAALQIKTAAENMAQFALGDEFANSEGDTVMQEACEEYLLATLEFMQKAVISLTESVVQGLGNGAKMDDTAFMPGELNSVKGEELDGSWDEEEEEGDEE